MMKHYYIVLLLLWTALGFGQTEIFNFDGGG